MCVCRKKECDVYPKAQQGSWDPFCDDSILQPMKGLAVPLGLFMLLHTTREKEREGDADMR